MADRKAAGTKDDPWVLKTPPGTSEYRMWRDEAADPPALVCQVGSTQLKYHLRAIEDLHAALKGLLETLHKRILKEKERRMTERKRHHSG